jgi:hypothetical protein
MFCYSTTNRAAYSFDLYLGLAFGQLSAIVTWCMFKIGNREYCWTLPYVGCVVAGLFVAPDRILDTWTVVAIAYSVFFSLYVTLLFVVLWLLKQSRFDSNSGNSVGLRAWQVSMKHLLAVTSVVAILCAAITRSVLFSGEVMLMLVPWISNHLCVAGIAVLVQVSVRHVGLRVVLTLIAAFVAWIALSLTFSQLPNTSSGKGPFLVMNLIQAVVMLLWLEIGGIVPYVFATVDKFATSETPDLQSPTDA